MAVSKAQSVATIAAGASLSDAVDLINYDLVALQIGANWTAASITFQSSEDGVEYSNVYDSGGTEISYAGAGASRFILVNTAHLGQFGRYIKIRSGTAAVPVNQVSGATVKCIGRAP